ncbi:LysE family translocator [Pseudohongiella spirulinae]|uniref:Threonine transporter RhtB n=1 Tax=Pseudohongiella spirulinae TaxID=1249552 RepID=A0A0S2KC98_9GAMM|nr:LysE family translocator [Pseudohongiella spirulinae]ALO45932.1 threonine transporter RhtB [Pseudohongiella spirulinae]
MIPIETISVFFAASVALALAPGPDNIFVLTQSALSGRAAGLVVTLGLCTGLIVHTLAVAFGVAVIFQTSAMAFNALKLIGAAYLLYLAWQAFKARPSDMTLGANGKLTRRKLYLRGVVMNVTNPKVAIFFLAFLPQFADPTRGSVALQMVAFGAIFMLAAFVVFGAVSWASGFLSEWLRHSERAQVIMNRVAGTVFVGLVARLVVTQR